MLDNKSSSTPIPRKKLTLKEFVNENDKLLTAIGVMGALAALFSVVPNGQYVAFLSFLMLLVLYAELYRSVMHIRAEGTMYVFQYLALGFPVALIIFIAQAYWLYFKNYFIPFLITFTFISVFPASSKKLSRKKALIIYISLDVAIVVIYYVLLLPRLPATLPLNGGNQTAT